MAKHQPVRLPEIRPLCDTFPMKYYYVQVKVLSRYGKSRKIDIYGLDSISLAVNILSVNAWVAGTTLNRQTLPINVIFRKFNILI